MKQSIKKVIILFTIFNANSIFSSIPNIYTMGTANGLTNNKCSSANSQTCALEYIGDTGTLNSLYNLATQMKNYIDGDNNAPNKTANLFKSLSALAALINNTITIKPNETLTQFWYVTNNSSNDTISNIKFPSSILNSINTQLKLTPVIINIATTASQLTIKVSDSTGKETTYPAQKISNGQTIQNMYFNYYSSDQPTTQKRLNISNNFNNVNIIVGSEPSLNKLLQKLELAYISNIKYYIDNLIYLKSGTPNSTWATWFKQFIKLINALFGTNATYSPMATAQEVNDAINSIPATQQANKTLAGTLNAFWGPINNLDRLLTYYYGKHNWHGKIQKLIPQMKNNIANIATSTTSINLIQLPNDLKAFRHDLNAIIALNLHIDDGNISFGTYLATIRSTYNTLITQLNAIGYLPDLSLKMLS